MLSLINVLYGGTCAIDDPGCYLCISSTDPGLGCAVCAEGYKKVSPSTSVPLATKWPEKTTKWPEKGRRSILGKIQVQHKFEKSSVAAPYCLGSPFKAKLENDVLLKVGEIKGAINETAVAKDDALASIRDAVSSKLREVEDLKGNALASLGEALKSKMQQVEEVKEGAISSLQDAVALKKQQADTVKENELPSLLPIAVNSTLLQEKDALPSSLPAAVNSTLLPLQADESKEEGALPLSSARAALDAARTRLKNLFRDQESGASEVKSELSSLVNEMDVAGEKY